MTHLGFYSTLGVLVRGAGQGFIHDLVRQGGSHLAGEPRPSAATGPSSTWVTRIAVRRAASRLATRRETWSLDDEAHASMSATALPAATDLELDTIDAEARASLWAAVAALSPGQREAVALRFAHDLSIDEIASLTATPAGTVKSRLHRALVTLRGQLEGSVDT